MEHIELERSRDFGDLLNDTFVIVRQNFVPLLKSYLAICGVFMLATICLGIIVNAQLATIEQSQQVFSIYYWLELAISITSYTAMTLTVTSYLAVYKEKGNRPAEVAEVWGYFKYYFFRLTGMVIITGIITIVGFLFCFAPGVYLAIVFALVPPVMVIENGSIDYTFRRVFQIIKGNWWQTFGVLLIMFILAAIGLALIAVPAYLLTGTSEWLTGKNLDGSLGVFNAIFTGIGSVFYIVPTVCIVLIYFDMVEVKESNSLASRIKMFGQSSGDAANQSPEQY